MNTIKLDHWFINNNELAISLMNFYTSINIVNDGKILYKVRVVNTSAKIKEMTFEFDSLENAITFIEEVVSSCRTFEEVAIGYSMFHVGNDKIYIKER